MTSDSSRFCQFRVIKTKNNGRRRRVTVQRLRSFGKSEKYRIEKKKNGVLSPRPLPLVEENNGFIEKCKLLASSAERASHGAVSIIGKRLEMEDAVRVEIGFVRGSCGEGYDFFGVYDGHGGLQVAKACSERLHRVVAEGVEREGGERVGWERVMVEGFEKMDGEVNGIGDEALNTVGSTAVVAVVGKEAVVVANCGDSRAVLYRGGSPVALSVDHKPERPDELRRIEAAGGRVINWNGYRVLGVLSASRSIGDQYLKPFVIPVPEVTITQRTNEDEFLILASDGLWDVVTNEFACEVVRKCLDGRLRRRRTSPDAAAQNKAAEAAAVLAELAVSRGSHDNISIIVVELNKFSNFC